MTRRPCSTSSAIAFEQSSWRLVIATCNECYPASGVKGYSVVRRAPAFLPSIVDGLRPVSPAHGVIRTVLCKALFALTHSGDNWGDVGHSHDLLLVAKVKGCWAATVMISKCGVNRHSWIHGVGEYERPHLRSILARPQVMALASTGRLEPSLVLPMPQIISFIQNWQLPPFSVNYISFVGTCTFAKPFSISLPSMQRLLQAESYGLGRFDNFL
jgi:hypothetical protein